ncbi:MAG: hypothetical protein PHY64_14795 [Eubacteriales bacterium]|nr:hypothetical protein [Eubacteriales bacterium]
MLVFPMLMCYTHFAFGLIQSVSGQFRPGKKEGFIERVDIVFLSHVTCFFGIGARKALRSRIPKKSRGGREDNSCPLFLIAFRQTGFAKSCGGEAAHFSKAVQI